MTLLTPSDPAIKPWGFKHYDDILVREFISQKYAENAQKQIVSNFTENAIHVFHSIFPYFNEMKGKTDGVVLCLRQYRPFPNESNNKSSGASLKEKKIILKENILEHNMRPVASEKIEGKLAQKLQDAQRHVTLGENSKWYSNRSKVAVPHLQNETPQNLGLSLSDDNSSPFILDVSATSTQGRRESMEDFRLIRMINIQGKLSPLFAVFDGHGGRGCAEYISKHLAEHIEQRLTLALKDSSKKPHDELYNILRTAFVVLGREYRKEQSEKSSKNSKITFSEPSTPATTATALLLFDGQLYTANMGDSRAVLSEISKESASTLALSEDACLLIPKYAEGVKKRGGQIVFTYDAPRVNGIPNMARVAGYDELKGFNPIADVTRISLSDLEPKKEYRLTIATDGLWKEVSSEQITETINSAKDQSPQYLADYFTREAYAVGGDDNITTIVVGLSSKGIATISTEKGTAIDIEGEFERLCISKSVSMDDLNLGYTSTTPLEFS